MILVDRAVWAWRGRRWAHLVSDSHFDELHQFAASIGKRRIGFQGDHYDVDEVQRRRAIDAGAVEVDARTLVRRLVASGLRERSGTPTWRVHQEGPWMGVDLSATISTVLPDASALLRRHAAESLEAVTAVDLDAQSTDLPEVLIVSRPDAHAVVLTGGAPPRAATSEPLARHLHRHIGYDLDHMGGRRAVELIERRQR